MKTKKEMKKRDIQQVQKQVEKVSRFRYIVSWELDSYGTFSPLEAAMDALDTIRSDGSLAHVFIVTDRDTGKKYMVDLDEIEDDKVEEIN